MIGKWLKSRGRRERVLIATKVGWEVSPERKGLSKAYIVRAVEDSLSRLQTDYIDLYQSHKDDPNTPVDETLEAYAQLVRQGKVRVIGASNFSAERLAESLASAERHRWPRYESLQPLYNLYDRFDFEEDLQGLCRREHVGVINYYALAAGFLTGKYRGPEDATRSARGAMVVQKYLETNAAPAAVLACPVPAYGLMPSSFRLAWTRPSLFAGLNAVAGGGHASPEVLEEALFSGSIDPERLARFHRRTQRESRRALFDMSGWSLPRFWRSAGVPLLVLGAEKDSLIAHGEAQATARLIGADYRLLPGLGHAIMLDEGWERAAQTIRAWLDGGALYDGPH